MTVLLELSVWVAKELELLELQELHGAVPRLV